MLLPIAHAKDLKSFENPLEAPSLLALLTEVLNVVLILAVPIVMFFLIYAGFNYVTARGNGDEIKKASQSLLYAIIGGVIILGGYAIVEIIENTINAF